MNDVQRLTCRVVFSTHRMGRWLLFHRAIMPCKPPKNKNISLELLKRAWCRLGNVCMSIIERHIGCFAVIACDIILLRVRGYCAGCFPSWMNSCYPSGAYRSLFALWRGRGNKRHVCYGERRQRSMAVSWDCKRLNMVFRLVAIEYSFIWFCTVAELERTPLSAIWQHKIVVQQLAVYQCQRSYSSFNQSAHSKDFEKPTLKQTETVNERKKIKFWMN